MPFDSIVIFGAVLRTLVDIHAHYEARGEQVVGITMYEHDGEQFQAGVTDSARKLFHVKLRVTEQGIHEYGREEDG